MGKKAIKSMRGQVIDSRGFSLIEVALALLIFSLLAIPYFHLQEVKRVDEIRDRTEQGIDQIVKASLRQYALANNAYPVPATPTLSPEDDGYGQSVDVMTVNKSCGSYSGLVCFAPGSRDTNGDGIPANTFPELVLVGALPFAELGLPERYSLDAYGSKLTYAVTYGLTDETTFSNDGGVIAVLDNSGDYARGTTNGSGEPIVHYVIVSHGEDQVGAHSRQGVRIQPCNNISQDAKNCNGFAKFTNNFGVTEIINGIPNYVRIESVGNPGSSEYYDDYVGFETTTNLGYWAFNADKDIDGLFSRAENILIGSEGILPVPEAKVDVTGNISAHRLDTNRICPSEGCECVEAGVQTDDSRPTCTEYNGQRPRGVFDPAVIADPNIPVAEKMTGGGISCGSSAMTGISNADEECEFTALLKGVTITKCANGQYPIGIDPSFDGVFKCQDPPLP